MQPWQWHLQAQRLVPPGCWLPPQTSRSCPALRRQGLCVHVWSKRGRDDMRVPESTKGCPYSATSLLHTNTHARTHTRTHTRTHAQRSACICTRARQGQNRVLQGHRIATLHPYSSGGEIQPQFCQGCLYKAKERKGLTPGWWLRLGHARLHGALPPQQPSSHPPAASPAAEPPCMATAKSCII